MNKIRKDIALNTHERNIHVHIFGSLALNSSDGDLDQDLDSLNFKTRRFFSFFFPSGLRREELLTLSPSDLAKKLQEVGLPKTLTQCLEGKDCIE